MSRVEENDVNGRLVAVESDVSHLRTEMRDLKSEMKDLRSEVKDLRGDMYSMKDSLVSRLEALRVDIVMTKVWTMGMLATVLAVMAHGFHWL